MLLGLLRSQAGHRDHRAPLLPFSVKVVIGAVESHRGICVSWLKRETRRERIQHRSARVNASREGMCLM